ncbi:Ribonuclease T2 precursor (RNase T2) [Emydomyces testavorans]|uniref:Ribonuclease T2-like n=1 Tax=Emydomyces testavorans TaxID=2070801 RepID=A0AAF0DIZ7_9EURO|nr:Ribonuclease T2 precursor (RNase T2) [Emydomyces testavorans]
MRPTTGAAFLATICFQTAAAFSASQLLLREEDGSSKKCPADVELSCHNTRPVQDTCCFNTPGGLLLQTQFWDTHPATGPENSWTIHGLWPDNCDGSFEEYCDKNREYRNITDILESYGKTELLNYMSIYWKDYQGDDENLWEHEWNKHGTCISTLETKCYSSYTPQAEVVDYLEKTAGLFKGLDTYKALAAAGIKPHSTKTYTLSQLQSALSKVHGMPVTLNCKNSQLKEVWYFFNVKGSVQTGKYVPAHPGSFPLKKKERDPPVPAAGSPRPTTPTRSGSPSPTGTDGPFSGKGNLEVTTGGKKIGCLISYGTWYSTGTCATFTATPSGDGFTLHSSKGDCGIVDSIFECDTGVEASVFTTEFQEERPKSRFIPTDIRLN